MTQEQQIRVDGPSAMDKLNSRVRRAPDKEARSFIRENMAERYLPFALSDMQQAYWIGRDTSLGGGGVAQQSYFELDCSSLDLSRVRRAFDALIARHEMLRAVVTEDGQQRILPLPLSFPLHEEDLTGLAPEAQQQRLQAIGDTMIATVSDLGTWPQMEVRFSRTGADGKGCLHCRFDLWAMDGRSFQLVLDELVELYQDSNASLPSLDVSFRDYITALEKHKDSKEYKASEAYWQKRLKTLPPAPALPKPQQSKKSGAATVTRRDDALTEEETRSLQAACAERGLSLQSVLGAAYGEVLGLWSGADNFTLNAPRFNRNFGWHPDINNVVGEFATFTLLEVDNSPARTFAEKAGAFQNETWAGMENGHVSGMYLLREMSRARGELDTEVMPVIFTAMPDMQEQDGDFETRLARIGTMNRLYGATPQTTLDCIFSVFSRRLRIYWSSRDEAFPENSVPDMFGEYMRIVRLLSASKAAWEETRLAALPAYQKERRSSGNNRQMPLPEATVFTLFAEQVKNTPEALAIIDGDERISYRALYAEALRLGGLVTAHVNAAVPMGVRNGAAAQRDIPMNSTADVSVALLLRRGWRAVAAALAAHAAGYPFMPLDSANPAERLHSMLRTGNAAVVLTESALADRVQAAGYPVVEIDTQNQSGEATLFAGTAAQGAGSATDTAAYVMLTSGTTGTPKAVTVGHKGLLNMVLYSNRRFKVTASDRFFAMTAMHHDLSVYDLFGALTAGAALVIVPQESTLDPDVWADLAVRHTVTVWNSVPGFHNALMDHCIAAGIRLPIRLQILGGDWVMPEITGKIAQVCPHSELYSIGGPTETTIWNIMHRVQGVPEDWGWIPYGEPIDNNSYHILDSTLRDVPDWCVGEMYCGGLGVCMGTTGDSPENSVFVRHPVTGERLYRTGDMGFYHSDGLIEILGRVDSQMNIGGYRFDPGEVEKSLAACPGVQRATLAAVALEGEAHVRGGEILGAYVVCNGVPVAEQTLSDYLQQRFPLPMVPRLWVFGNESPLTGNGKHDRKIIGQMIAKAAQSGGVQAPGGEDDKAAATPLEKMITGIWADILGSEEPGMHANFFRCGGDSLKAIQMLNRIKARIPVSLSLATFFATPTPDTLTSMVLDGVAAGMKSG